MTYRTYEDEDGSLSYEQDFEFELHDAHALVSGAYAWDEGAEGGSAYGEQNDRWAEARGVRVDKIHVTADDDRIDETWSGGMPPRPWSALGLAMAVAEERMVDEVSV